MSAVPEYQEYVYVSRPTGDSLLHMPHDTSIKPFNILVGYTVSVLTAVSTRFLSLSSNIPPGRAVCPPSKRKVFALVVNKTLSCTESSYNSTSTAPSFDFGYDELQRREGVKSSTELVTATNDERTDLLVAALRRQKSLLSVGHMSSALRIVIQEFLWVSLARVYHSWL